MKPILTITSLVAMFSMSSYGFSQGDDVIVTTTSVVELLPYGEDNVLETFGLMQSMGESGGCASGFVPCVFHFGSLSGAAGSVISGYEQGDLNLGLSVMSADGICDGNTLALHRDIEDPCQAVAVAWHEAQHYDRGGPINTCDHGELYQCTADLMRFLNENCGCSISAAAIDAMDAAAENYREKCNW